MFGGPKSVCQNDVVFKNDILSNSMEIEDEEGKPLDPLTSGELKDELLTFLFAGHETTTVLLTWLFYNLSKYPQVEEKVLKEIKEVIGSNSNSIPITWEQIQNLHYLNNVIKETLRLDNSTPGFIRETIYEETLGNLKIPPKTPLYIPTYSIHRDPEIWNDPEKFDPERFNVENSRGRSPFAWMPFAAGARNCIGMQFALLEARSVIARLLPQFKMLPRDKPSTEVTTLMRPQEMNVVIQFR